MQRGRQATARAGWRGAISAQETASSTELGAEPQLLTKSSWDPRWLTSIRRVVARDQLPRGDTHHTWDGAPTVHSGNQASGMGEVIRCTFSPGESVLAKKLVNWASWTWERHKMHAQLSLCLCGVPEKLNLNQNGLDLGSACNPGPALDSFPAEQPYKCRPGDHMCHERWQTQCGIDTASTPQIRQWYLFAVFLPPYSTAEQVSLSKWPPLAPCVRAGIRHWRDLQTEEAKINRGNCLGSDRCNRLNLGS